MARAHGLHAKRSTPHRTGATKCHAPLQPGLQRRRDPPIHPWRAPMRSISRGRNTTAFDLRRPTPGHLCCGCRCRRRGTGEPFCEPVAERECDRKGDDAKGDNANKSEEPTAERADHGERERDDKGNKKQTLSRGKFIRKVDEKYDGENAEHDKTDIERVEGKIQGAKTGKKDYLEEDIVIETPREGPRIRKIIRHKAHSARNLRIIHHGLRATWMEIDDP